MWPFAVAPHTFFTLFIVHSLILILYVLLVQYGPQSDASNEVNSEYNVHHANIWDEYSPHPNYQLHNDHQITVFQDVHIMIFIGFGFLMTFLKRYGLSSVSLNFLIASLVLEWAILINGFFHLHHGYIEVDITSLLGADFTAAAVLISFGVVLGKTTPSQLIIMALVEVPIFALNEVIGRKYLKAVDIGDSMFVHAFGAYFGLAVSFSMFRKDTDSENLGSSVTSDLFSMIGTVFLWCFWPSFNSALAPGDDQHRAVINTYLSLVASCVVACAVSSLLHKSGKFTMEHIQNATLAGGVAIGAAADLMVQPYGAMLVGSMAGAISVLGFEKVTPLMDRVCRLHDTCGVHNLHGLPAILAAIVAAIMAAASSEEVYHASVYTIFPAMAPVANSTQLKTLQEEHPHIHAGLDRTAGSQAWYQLGALLVTLIVAIVGGLLTGLLMRLPVWERLESGDLYSDRRYFVIHDEEEAHEGERPHSHQTPDKGV